MDTDELAITATIETIDGNMLERVWDEMYYRVDICWVTNAARTEHLWGT
jgi:hypothetical protein